MRLNKWFDFYYKHKGRCPECGRWLVPHMGCVGWIFGDNKQECSINKLSRESYSQGPEKFDYFVKKMRKRLKYKTNERINVDIQRKKTYLKLNN